MGDWDHMVAGCQTLWEHDMLITPASFPAVPANRNLVRFSITAANTEDEVDRAIGALRAISQSWHQTPDRAEAVPRALRRVIRG